MNVAKKIIHIRYNDSEMFIMSPYDPDFVSALKKSTISRKWNRENKEWVIAIKEREAALNVVRQFFLLVEDNKLLQPLEPLSCFDAVDKYIANVPLEVWIDGACEPVNPGGTASYGLVVKQRDKTILRKAEVVGSGEKMSNNVAEYCALIALLEWCKANNINSNITVYSDSILLVNQMSGKWKTKSKSQKGLYFPFYQKALSLLIRLGRKQFHFQWTARDRNTEADELSKQVIPP